MKIEEISFDSDDKTLFLIDDLRLKADAIRYSILPKLEIITNEIISRISEIYEINLFENYIIGRSPQFRKSENNRKNEIKINYNFSSVWLYGQRAKSKWVGLINKENKVAQITPALLGIQLTSEGINTVFHFGYVKNFNEETYRKFYNFIDSELINIISLINSSNTYIRYLYFDLINLKETFKKKFKNKEYDIVISSNPVDYPINYQKINDIILSNIFLFPILNAFLQISLGLKPNLAADLQKLELKLEEYYNKYLPDENIEEQEEIKIDQKDIKERAENKIKVQAGIRWQVFKRDNWKCLSCGRSAEDDAILHVDHILPRSKGGKDELNNYQTLCETCNIGKSNKDETDLRKK